MAGREIEIEVGVGVETGTGNGTTLLLLSCQVIQGATAVWRMGVALYGVAWRRGGVEANPKRAIMPGAGAGAGAG